MISLARQFVASIDHNELARLPESCRPGKLLDTQDVMAYAYELVRRYSVDGDPAVKRRVGAAREVDAPAHVPPSLEMARARVAIACGDRSRQHRIRQRERGHNVPARCEHSAIMLVSRNVGSAFSVDRQSN